MKRHQILILIVSTFLLYNCTTEDDENLPLDLSNFDNFKMQFTVYYDNSVNEVASYKLRNFHTNGSDEIIFNTESIENIITSSSDSTVYIFNVKEYKQVGVTIEALNNVKSYEWRIYEEDFFIDYFYSGILAIESDPQVFPQEPIQTILYDFETGDMSFDPIN